MSRVGFALSSAQFPAALLFFLHFDRDLRLLDWGPSIAKIRPDLTRGLPWDQVLNLRRPNAPNPTFAELADHGSSVCQLDLLGAQSRSTLLSGQLLVSGSELCFIGSPRVPELADLR